MGLSHIGSDRNRWQGSAAELLARRTQIVLVAHRLAAAMSYRFEYRVTPEATELRISGPRGNLPTDLWSIEAPSSLLPGVDLAQRLIAAGAAISEDDTVFIEHRAVSGLSASEAKSIGSAAYFGCRCSS